MILTLQITDEALSALKDQLRVSKIDYDIVVSSSDRAVLSPDSYARRILRARKILELSVAKEDACYD